ncbi:MAG: hypothetical protein ACOC3U_05040 [Thiohalospira sp.]
MRAGWLLALLTGLAAGSAVAEDRIWLVGGGPDAAGSQVSIELNTRWIAGWLREEGLGPRLRIRYNDGDAPGADVKLRRRDRAGTDLSPLVHVFGAPGTEGEAYRNHRVRGVEGSTRVEELTRALEADFRELESGDDLWFIYQGHGLADHADYSRNTLRLWGDTELSVRRLEGLLDEVEPGVTTRFFFPQCYSGGFARLMYDDPAAPGELAGGRCGFLAQAPDRQSEGCTSSIEAGEYRDYSTYFFAALAGEQRTGESLEHDPDRDGDGRVDLREAHLHALATAESADLSRATSEVFLEEWEPWWLRWVGTRGVPDNTYGELAATVAERLGLDPTDPVPALHQGLDRTKGEGERLRRELDAARERVRELQRAVRERAEVRWPALASRYSTAALERLTSEPEPILEWLHRDPDYPDLVAAIERQRELEAEELAVQRERAGYERILRLRRLARLQEKFRRYASEEERAAYRALVACESWAPERP